MCHITDRLENWAKWRHSSGERSANISQTGLICENMRRYSGTVVRRASGAALGTDENDAELVDRRIGALPDRLLLLLWWHYVKRAAPSIICRKLKIPHRPTSAFDRLLAAAHAEIESILTR